jgi:hypothetical protein
MIGEGGEWRGVITHRGWKRTERRIPRVALIDPHCVIVCNRCQTLTFAPGS